MKISSCKVECDHMTYDDKVSTCQPERALSVIRDYSRNFDGFQTNGQILTIKDIDGQVVDEFVFNAELAKNEIKTIFGDALQRIERPFDLGNSNACLVFSKKSN